MADTSAHAFDNREGLNLKYESGETGFTRFWPWTTWYVRRCQDGADIAAD